MESPEGTRSAKFVFLLLPGLPMMSLMSAIEPLRAANRLTDQVLFEWTFASLDGGPVTASNGIDLFTKALSDIQERLDFIFVCRGIPTEADLEHRYVQALPVAAGSCAVVGALSTGTTLLARAGLLAGFNCTIHWENIPAFMEEFPRLACTGSLFEIDRNRITCSGGIAAMDMVLRLIGEAHGSELAVRVANQFHHERIRKAGDEQHGWDDLNHARFPRGMRRAIELMQSNIETPLAVSHICTKIGMTTRQLERSFIRYLEVTPTGYYLKLRLARAREMLAYSNLPIAEIAIATGFASTSHLARWIRRVYQATPTDLRHT